MVNFTIMPGESLNDARVRLGMLPIDEQMITKLLAAMKSEPTYKEQIQAMLKGVNTPVDQIGP